MRNLLKPDGSMWEFYLRLDLNQRPLAYESHAGFRDLAAVERIKRYCYCGATVGWSNLCVAGMIFGYIGRESASYSIVGQSALEVTLYWVGAGLRSSLRRL
jgi:hypothetical protein